MKGAVCSALMLIAFAQTASAAVQDNSKASEYIIAAIELKPPVVRSPIVTVECEAAWKRACSDQCDGEYGYFCFFGTVCNPDSHRCEKTAP
jgi:hypothetical protein